MSFTRPDLAAITAALFLAIGVGSATAAPFSADYVFGDSLSDRGNLAEAVGHNFPNPPFFHDSFTNGPTAVQVMAQRLGLSADPSLFVTGFTDTHGLGLTAGTNYAVAGATAGDLNGEGVPGANLTAQVGAFVAHSDGTAPASALYTVFIGGNDVRTAAHQGSAAYVTQGVQTELGAIQALETAGARSLLVVNVPDVGLIPEFTQGFPTQVAAAHADSIAYDQQLAAGVAALAAANPSVSINLFDLYGFNNDYIATAASHGITNTTEPCYLNTGAGITNPAAPVQINPACGTIDPATGEAANINQFQYWDAIHPTATLQAALGNALYATEVPEPASQTLLVAGVVAIMLGRRARQGRKRRQG